MTLESPEPATPRRGTVRPEWARYHRRVGSFRSPSGDRSLQLQRLRDLLRMAVVEHAGAGGDVRLDSESELPDVATSLSDHAGVGAISAELLHWHRGPVPAVVADRLDDVEPQHPILCMEYVLTLDAQPMGLITNYLRPAEAAAMEPAHFDRDFYGLLDAHGVDMHSYDIEMAAQAADARVADLLAVEKGAPTQLFEQTIRDSSGARFDFAIGRLRREMRMRITGIGRVLPDAG